MADDVTTDAPAPAAQADTSTSDTAAVTSPGGDASTADSVGTAGSTLLSGAEPPAEDVAGAEPAASGTQWEPKDLTLPEGSTLDAAALERIAATARARGLPKDAAQALVELVDSDARQRTEAQTQAVRSTVEAWKAEALAHPEIAGGNAAERDRNLALAKQAALKYFGEAAMPVFESTGIGNHPALLAGLIRIAKASGEGTLALPNGAPGGARPQSLAEKLYGDSMNPDRTAA